MVVPATAPSLGRTCTRVLTLLVVAMTSSACQKKSDEAFEVFQTPPPANLPRHWQVPPFSLVERNGATTTDANLRGKVWVADFFYTTCPGPCPMMTSRLQQLHEKTRGWNDVMLVSISTDPAKDTPEVLQQYASRFGADERWLFLTGEKKAIFELANKGFKLSVTEEGGTATEPVTHSTKLVLVDRNGTVRGFYEGTTDSESARLITDIDRLRKESR
jgi:cytochrome oxidase Cu insertion factor (SCO1/SenC/PrrC family)